jgi:integrase
MQSRAFAGKSWKENGLVFPSEVGTPLEECNVLRRFQAICEANGLPKLRLYDLRHSHASLLIHEGVHPKKISERLGHSSIKLTMETYGHLRRERPRLSRKDGAPVRRRADEVSRPDDAGTKPGC